MLGSGYEIDDVVGKYLVITVRDDGLVIPLDRSYVEIMVGDGQIAQFLVEQHRVAMQLHPYHQQFAVVESAPITRPVVVEGHSYLIGGEILRISTPNSRSTCLFSGTRNSQLSILATVFDAPSFFAIAQLVMLRVS